MKIYRVVPNGFATRERLNNARTCPEEIYYQMGYASVPRKTPHKFNNLDCGGKIGKYFFLFVEDAVAIGNSFLSNFHHLSSSTCTILEYDVPEDLIFKHIGCGDYKDDIFPLDLAETFIEKEDLGDNPINSYDIADIEKEKHFLQAFERFLKLMINYGRYLDDDIYFYLNHFWIDDLSDVLNNFDEYKSSLLKTPLFNAFLNDFRKLIPCCFITGKVLLANQDLLTRTNGEYLGTTLDYSKEQREFKKEIINNLYKNPESKDIENVRRLLKERKYL